jgi:GNAT superfamily N-acetyltransferase
MGDNEARIRQLEQHAAESFALLMASAPELGAEVHRMAGATAFRWSAVPTVLFNRVLGLGLDHMPTDDEIGAVLALYRSAGLPCYIQLCPLANWQELGQRLEASGLQRHPSWPVLALIADHWIPVSAQPSIVIELVDTTNRADFIRVMLEAFGMKPPLDRAIAASLDSPAVFGFLARYDGEPAGTGMLVLQAGVAGLYSGGVLASFRRRGIHSALIAARVRMAIDRGFELIYSETEEIGNQSHRDLARQGFFVVYEHVNWHLPPSTKGNDHGG